MYYSVTHSLVWDFKRNHKFRRQTVIQMPELTSQNTCPKYAEKNERQQLDDEPLIVVLNVE